MNYIISGLLFFLFCFGTALTNAQSILKADSLNINRKYKEAIAEYDKVILTYPGTSISETDVAHAFLQKGVCYYYLDNLDSSLVCYFEALKIFEKNEDVKKLSITTSNISNIYYYMEDFTNAEKYLNYSLNYSKISKDSSQLERLLFQKGLILHEQGKTEAAIQLYKTQLNYSFQSDNPLVARYYNNLGHFYFITDYDSSLQYLLLAEQKGGQLDSSLLYTIFSNIGSIYIKKKKFREALEYFDKSLRSLEMDFDSTVKATTYRALAKVYDSLKIYDSAFLYLQKASEIESKLNAADKVRANKELSEKYESDKKDEKIRTQEIENRLKSRNLWLSLGGATLAAALAVVSFISYQRKQKANRLLIAQNEHIEKLNKDLDASNQVKTKLFSVISHDLRGPVSSLYAYLQLKNNVSDTTDKTIIRQTEQLLEDLEDLLVWSKSQLHQFVPFQQDIYLYDLCNDVSSLLYTGMLQKNNRIVNHIRPPLMIRSDLNILTIVLRNILSNAIKYAVPGSAIEVNAKMDREQATITVTNDTGSENLQQLCALQDETVTSEKSGLGITLVKEFMTKLRGQFAYTTAQNRVAAVITLPLSEQPISPASA